MTVLGVGKVRSLFDVTWPEYHHLNANNELLSPQFYHGRLPSEPDRHTCTNTPLHRRTNLPAAASKIPTIRSLDTQLADGMTCPTPRAWCSYTLNPWILPFAGDHHVPGQKNVCLTMRTYAQLGDPDGVVRFAPLYPETPFSSERFTLHFRRSQRTSRSPAAASRTNACERPESRA